ncbi:proteasome maturation factor UMP1-domain-containing protein [Lentinula guzmanii]|uniref:Proteasome maturation factor UMP1-domain-containing protein n=3 Tax=Lentinula TaxID=5352 RepID=A0AA38J656_9AGAR|nr:proteasome maturation factor UMP1-domain-containing protein [Lentinula guzmanii]KAJ3751083.1 proteasome maturation factor UMP1-domain-containing protein [Lentinula detonsa]KAJ3789738.1 proteasome maturation factor UMP1-domain-containing protein [Lentinula aff. detonsa]KAJ3802564.1 proteasome maturation factor UMP1-domain-containing protein [Lentinula aff. detonsa]
MDPSFRIVPASAPKSASVAQTSNSLGLHDTLRYGPRMIATEVKTEGDLKDRLQNWEETQDNLKLTMMRNTYGLHAPMRLLMERNIVSANPHMPVLPQTNLQLDILMGRDESIEAADVFAGPLNGPPLDIHYDMEKKHRI